MKKFATLYCMYDTYLPIDLETCTSKLILIDTILKLVHDIQKRSLIQICLCRSHPSHGRGVGNQECSCNQGCLSQDPHFVSGLCPNQEVPMYVLAELQGGTENDGGMRYVAKDCTMLGFCIYTQARNDPFKWRPCFIILTPRHIYSQRSETYDCVLKMEVNP